MTSRAQLFVQIRAPFLGFCQQKPEQTDDKAGKDTDNDAFPEQFKLKAVPVV